MAPKLHARFAGYAPADSVHSRALFRLQELVEAGSAGRLTVDVVANVLDQGLSAEEMLRRTETGELAVCYLSTSYLTDRSPKLGVFDLPFLFSSREHAFAVLDGPLGAAMASDLEAAGRLKHLGFWENGFRHVTNTVRPIRVPADLAGLRIRLQPNALHARAFRLLGAEPVLTDVKELLAAFVDGRVDAQENPLDNTWLYGVYRYTRYVSLTAHFFGVRELLASRAWFDGLPADLQSVVEIAARDATALQRRLAGQRDDELGQQLAEHGCLINDVDPIARPAFRQAVEPVYAEAGREIGEAFIARVQAAF